MKRKILFLLLPALLLAGCNKDELGGAPDTPGGTADAIRFEIGFAADDNPTARAATAPDFKPSWEDGDEIGLFIVQGGGGLQASGNWVDNMKLTRQNDGTWLYTFPSGKGYYPCSTDQLHFYAYYPYDAAMTDPTAYTFSVKSDQRVEADYNKSDLLLAKTEGVTLSKNAVQLQFHHALALVQVEVKREVNVPLFGDDFTVTLRGAKPDAVLGWSTDLTATGTATDIVMHQVADMPYTYRALVPAQTLPATTKVSFVQTTSGKEIDMSYPGVASAVLAAKGTHKYSVTLGWGIDPTHAYAVGDVYPHVGPAVGIVYYITEGGKHGKVVGLQEKNNVKWADAYGTTNANDMTNGRANMRTIYNINTSSPFSGYPAFAWVHSLNNGTEDYSNPNATGVWYLPAKGELGDGNASSLYVAYNNYGKDAFNAKLTAAGGTVLGNYWYWSSSEYDHNYAWIVYFGDGFMYDGSKRNDTNRARCVLAF